MGVRRAVRAAIPFALALAGAAAAAATGDAVVAPEASQANELFLEIVVDGQDTGQIAPFRQGPHGLSSSVQNLRDLGLDPVLFGVDGRATFDLDAIPGLAYTYDAARQRIELRLADALRHPRELSAVGVRAAAPSEAGRGLLLNYNLHAQTGGNRTVGAITELRWFDGAGVLANTGAVVLHGPGRGWVRYDTTWTRADPDALTVLEIGDVIAPALAWTRALRMGGIQWRRNFSLRPDLLTYPLATYGGSAVVPSSLSLYVDGMRQFQADVGGGPFQLRGIGGVNGAGQATVVTEDALGRVSSAIVPLYVDTRMLAPGLTDYALALGAPRRGYGAHSFDYGPGAVLAGSLRTGVSSALTLEAHAEAARGIGVVGAGALLRLGGAGVVSGAFGASARPGAGPTRGRHALLGYQYIARGFAIDAQSERADAGYADAGNVQGAAAVRASDRLNLSAALGAGRSFGAAVIHYAVQGQSPARIVSVSLAGPLGWGLHGSVSAYRDLLRPDARGLQLTISMAFGGRAAGSASFGTQDGVATRALSGGAAPDVGGGYGWSAQAGRFGSQAYDQAQLQYLGGAGQVGVITQGIGRSRSTAVDASGAVIAMDGAVLPARHIGRGFALVATGMPGVPVLQENRPIGVTDANGRLLVPDLIPYTRNDIAIDTTALPADVRVASVSQSIVPRQSAGVVARFGLERHAAATVVVAVDGGVPPVGTPARLVGGKATVVGYDGVVFVEGLGAHNELIVGEGAAACGVRFAYVAADGALPTIGPLTCQPLKGESK